MDLFSPGFVEILAAEQTPDNPHWFQGTADAVRQAARHFVRHEADYYLILAGDHLYRMDYNEMIEAHVNRQADITIAAQPVTLDDASAMGLFRFDRNGHIVAFEEKPDARPARGDWPEHSGRRHLCGPLCRQAVHRVDGRLRLLARRAAGYARTRRLEGLRPRDHPGRARQYHVQAHLFTATGRMSAPSDSFYEANIMLTRPGAPFTFYDPHRPIYTHPRFLPGSRLSDCSVRT